MGVRRALFLAASALGQGNFELGAANFEEAVGTFLYVDYHLFVTDEKNVIREGLLASLPHHFC